MQLSTMLENVNLPNGLSFVYAVFLEEETRAWWTLNVQYMSTIWLALITDGEKEPDC